MRYQLTYKGQTANQILSDATVSVMQADVAEITHPQYPGAIFVQDDDGDLVITSSTGILVRLLCSKQAAERLQDLADKAEAKNQMLADGEEK